MIVDSVLTNTKAYLAGQIKECSIAIEEGKIVKIGREPQMPQADEKTNLKGMLLLPGLIDEHVHLRDEGKAYKEDFMSGTAAAAAGGFTTVLDMPNNEPVTMSKQSLTNRMELAARRILVNVGFHSEFPKKNTDIQQIISTGAVGFKIFMGTQVGGLDVDVDDDLIDAFKEVAPLKVPVAVHAEDQTMLRVNEEKLKKAKKTSVAAFQNAHSEEVEAKAIQRLLEISASADLHLHFCHVSTKVGLDAIDDAKKAGRQVTCEVTPNHLLLSTVDLQRVGQMLVMAPPLRNQDQVDALWRGLESGVVDSLGSDHAPHTLEEKAASSVWDVAVGVPGLETTLPLLITQIRKNRLSVNQVVSFLAEKPAEIYGLHGRGRIVEGSGADLTVVDFNQKFTIDASKFKSKAKFSPYDGWEVWGKTIKTYVEGLLIFDEGDIVAKPGSGSVVRRGNQ